MAKGHLGAVRNSTKDPDSLRNRWKVDWAERGGRWEGGCHACDFSKVKQQLPALSTHAESKGTLLLTPIVSCNNSTLIFDNSRESSTILNKSRHTDTRMYFFVSREERGRLRWGDFSGASGNDSDSHSVIEATADSGQRVILPQSSTVIDHRRDSEQRQSLPLPLR